jgi:REP element-mobilizing transposase RayT
MPNPPFALFITWTTYGTWLPGDPRGYVSNTLMETGRYAPKQNQRGQPISRGNPQTLAAAQKAQKHDTVWLLPQHAITVAEALKNAAAARHWHIIRAAVMAGHVHTLTAKCPDDGPAVRRILKGVSNAALCAAAGHPGRWWTRGGSGRYLHSQRSLEAVEEYIRNQHAILCEIINMQVIPRHQTP